MIVFAIAVGGFFTWQLHGLNSMRTGYEVDPRDKAAYLEAKLSEDLKIEHFDSTWLQQAWMNGFQDHTYLFVLSPDSPDFRAKLEKLAGPEPISGSRYRNGGYLGPSTAPTWWDTTVIDAAEGRYFQGESRSWRFTWLNGRLYIVLSAN